MNKPTSRSWVYLRSEPNLWTVGFYAPDGKWNPESDYNIQEEAARRVAWLNGSGVAEALPELVKLVKDVLSVGSIMPDNTPEKPSVIFGHPSGAEWAKIFLIACSALAKLEVKP